MEDTDGGLHPAVAGQSLGERRKSILWAGCLKQDKVPENGGFHTLDLYI